MSAEPTHSATAVSDGPVVTPQMRAVILMAETLAKYGPTHGVTVRRRRWWRNPGPMDFVPMAREIVATLFLLPDGWALSAEILLTPNRPHGPETAVPDDVS